MRRREPGGGEFAPEGGANLAGQDQRSFELLARRRQRQEIEVQLAERAMGAGEPLAMLDRERSLECLLRKLERRSIAPEVTQDGAELKLGEQLARAPAD